MNFDLVKHPEDIANIAKALEELKVKYGELIYRQYLKFYSSETPTSKSTLTTYLTKGVAKLNDYQIAHLSPLVSLFTDDENENTFRLRKIYADKFVELEDSFIAALRLLVDIRKNPKKYKPYTPVENKQFHFYAYQDKFVVYGGISPKVIYAGGTYMHEKNCLDKPELHLIEIFDTRVNRRINNFYGDEPTQHLKNIKKIIKYSNRAGIHVLSFPVWLIDSLGKNMVDELLILGFQANRGVVWKDLKSHR